MPLISSWTKSRRAQNDTDWETWIEGGVTPTLNAFDNATETRATVLIIDGTRVNDVRVYEDGIVPTVISRYGTGGGNVPMVFPIDDGRDVEKNQNGLGIGADGAPAYTLDRQQASAVAITDDEPIVMRDREGCAGGGKGPLMSKTAFTLATSNFHTIFPNSTTVRRLTPLECERLQGFPDNWTADQADSNRYKQMGNAVAVPVVQWIIDGVVGERDE